MTEPPSMITGGGSGAAIVGELVSSYTPPKGPLEGSPIGTWLALVPGAKCELANGAAGRLDVGGEVGRLRGSVKVKAGETLTAGETLMTLPEAIRPRVGVIATNNSASSSSAVALTLQIEAVTGIVRIVGASLASNVSVDLEGLTWSVTA